MEGLLKWSLSQQGDNAEARERAGNPDPQALAQLLGMVQGKDDPTLMKESAAILEDEKSTPEEKAAALGDMEMLIENLDNANNLKNMKLWEPVLKQLDSEDTKVQCLACSCIGSAVQNNPKSQKDFLEQPESSTAFAKIIKLAEDSKDEKVRVKAVYALASIIRHSKEAYGLFEQNNGWDLIPSILNSSDASDKLKIRALSLLSSIFSEEVERNKFSTAEGQEKIKRIHEDKIVNSMVKMLGKDADLNCIDKILNLLALLISHGYQFSDDEIKQISSKFKELKPIADRLNEDDYRTLKSVI
ncbi:DEKNAAC101930 [Brettanomyces naardenensis]|uniref:Hsp70 nucleotide exchange factor FES1 n=1 Tax=Brettanomyces naardenensis TaxID=13370 RepID=A0A448YJG9_BRENA|nr:DEKNAAC101930 [Brettanomyces naardenensis]